MNQVQAKVGAEADEKSATIKKEKIKILWVPSVNLQSEKDVKLLDKALDDQKDKIEDEVKNGGRPLEARIGLLDSNGLVEITFTQAI